jgi:hypothetical protein
MSRLRRSERPSNNMDVIKTLFTSLVTQLKPPDAEVQTLDGVRAKGA